MCNLVSHHLSPCHRDITTANHILTLSGLCASIIITVSLSFMCRHRVGTIIQPHRDLMPLCDVLCCAMLALCLIVLAWNELASGWAGLGWLWAGLGWIYLVGLCWFWVGAGCKTIRADTDRYHRYLMGCSVARTICIPVSYRIASAPVTICLLS